MAATPTTSERKPLLVFDHVSVQFGPHRVLNDIHLSIDSGQTVAIIGESGCGKTVFLKLAIGLLRPTTGRVLFDGQDMHQLNDHDLTQQRLRFGFLFQGAALFDSMNVFDNIAFGLREQRRTSEGEIREIVKKRLKQVGLTEAVLGKKPAELSGGMKKRVGLARALALNPEIMLYDEPTTGLDPIMTDVINELILQVRKQSLVTSIVVTHEMRTVAKVADRVVMLYPLPRLKKNEGQILYDGSAEHLQSCHDSRVVQFVTGEARDRLQDIANMTS